MITSPRPNFYESSEGFSVEVCIPTGLIYRERGCEMFIDSEILTGASGLVLYKSSITNWMPPNESRPVTGEDSVRIVENIRQVFRTQGFEIDVL